MSPLRRGARASLASAALVLGLTWLAAVASPARALDPVAPGVPGGGRAWELVTPAEVVPTRIAVPFGGTPFLAISKSGDRVAYRAIGAPPDANFGAFVTVSLATRGPAGWSSQSVPFPIPEATSVFSVSGEGPVAYDSELTASIALNTLFESEGKRALFASEPGGYRQLANLGFGGGFLATSGDLQRVLFSSSEHLLPADAPREEGTMSVYELEGSTLRLVDANDDGSLVSPCGANFAAASPDARQIFFTARVACEFTDVFLRAGGHTVDISTSRCTLPDCGEEFDVDFAGRAPGGGSAFLQTAERLTDADANGDGDLYRYDVAGDQLGLLFARPPQAGAYSLASQVRASSDGSRAYFAAEGQLLPQQETAGAPNLYLAEAGALDFIAALASPDFQVSDDGRFVVFVSPTALAGEDKDQSADLYRYDRESKTSALLSSGQGGSGNGAYAVELPSDNITADIGRRVFFLTAESLSAQDRNQLTDVYEWTQTGGVTLLGGGTPDLGSEYIGTTPDGGTVLFRTSATLLARDRDGGELDLYAARVGGGIADPPVPSGCEGGSCEAVAPPTRRGLPRAANRSPRQIELAQLDARARRQLVARGSTVVLAEVPAPGSLTASGRARFGGGEQIVVSGAAVAKQAGPLRLRLRLTAAGRKGLARGEMLRVRLLLRQATGPALKTRFKLRGGS